MYIHSDSCRLFEYLQPEDYTHLHTYTHEFQILFCKVLPGSFLCSPMNCGSLTYLPYQLTYVINSLGHWLKSSQIYNKIPMISHVSWLKSPCLMVRSPFTNPLGTWIPSVLRRPPEWPSRRRSVSLPAIDGFSLKKTIQLLGYPHNYGNLHIYDYIYICTIIYIIMYIYMYIYKKLLVHRI